MKAVEITLRDGSTKKVYPLKRTALKRSKVPINKVSKSQKKKNDSIAKSKQSLPDVCYYSGCYQTNTDLMHILNIGSYPQFSQEKRNHTRGCRLHHNLFDDNKEFRKTQTGLFNQVYEFAPMEATKYFNL